MIDKTFPSHVDGVVYEFCTYVYHFGPYPYESFEYPVDTIYQRHPIAEQIYAEMLGIA